MDRSFQLVLGKIFWVIASVMWMTAIIGHWFANNKLDTVYGLCMAIGLMLIASRMITDARHQESINSKE